MANPVIASNDTSQLLVFGGKFIDGTITFGAAETYAQGLIMGQVAVSSTVTAAADTGNTGNGTVTGAALAAGGPPKVGAYTLTCTEAVTNGGKFSLADPDGVLVATDITIPAGAGNTIVVTAGGLTFTITDGATDFALDDVFTLTVATGSNKWEPYNPAAVNGLQKPRGIIPVAYTSTGAGDLSRRLLVEGEVNDAKLSVEGGSVTDTTRALLREVDIFPVTRTQIDELDNS